MNRENSLIENKERQPYGNACYPKECENIWYLIQWGIYEIHTIWDENIPFLCSALNKIKRG